MKKKEWKERMLKMFLGDSGEGAEAVQPEGELPEEGEEAAEEDENKTLNNQNNANNGENGNQDGESCGVENPGKREPGSEEECGEEPGDGADQNGTADTPEDAEGIGLAGGDEATDEGAERASFESNLAESILRLEGFRAGRGISEEEFKEAVAMLITVTEKCRDGVIDTDLIDFALKGVMFDSRVALARHEGEIAGRNAGIKAWIDSSSASDGLPAPGGSAAQKGDAHASIFSLAGQAR